MVVRGKFARDKIVPISKVAHDYLALYLENRVYNKEGSVFCGIYGAAARLLRLVWAHLAVDLVQLWEKE